MADRRVPRPLAALLPAIALLGLAWALVLPIFQAPDENAHFAYAQSLAERGVLPGAADRPPASSEHELAAGASNAYQVPGYTQAKPTWSAAAEARWQREAEGAARDDLGGPNPATSNPPLAYALGLPAYFAASGGTMADRLLALRLTSVLFLLLTVVGVWLLAGELFARDRTLQLTAAGVAGFAPMLTFVSASVTPDALLYATWSFALWLGVRLLHRGLTLRTGAAFAAAIGLAAAVKATSFALLPAAVVVLVVGAVRRARPDRRGALVALVCAAGVVLGLGIASQLASVLLAPDGGARPLLAAPVAETASPREFLSYVWQFYLPATPLQNVYEFPGDPGLPLYDVWIKTSWAAFGWLETKFSEPVYGVLAGVTAVVAIGALVALVRARRRIDLAVAGFLALAVAALLGGLHLTDYRLIEAGTAGFMQGRYLFPLVGLFGAAVAGVVSLLPPGRRAMGAGVTLAALLVLQIASLGLVVLRFYA